jgi:hypothetical protein
MQTLKFEQWTVLVLLIVAGVIALEHVGYNSGAAIAASLHGIEHTLGQSL